jgi:hypothetical protein
MNQRLARGLIVSLFVVLAALLPAPARAQEAAAPVLGDPHHWAVSLERLFGVNYLSDTETMNGGTQRMSSTGFSFLSETPYADLASPRVAFDRLVSHGLSLGAALGVGHGSMTTTSSVTSAGPSAVNTTPAGPIEISSTTVLLAPRIGYAARISPRWTVWPRAGAILIYDTFDGGIGAERHHELAATIEAPVAFTVVPRVSLTLGPTFDLLFDWIDSPLLDPTTGGPSGATARSHARLLEIGVQAGLTIVL